MLYELLLPYRAQLGLTGALCMGAVAHWLGVLARTLGGLDHANVHFAAAAAMHERIASPPRLARTHLEWGQTLLARGDPGDAERARHLLQRALAAARQLRFGTVERRASGLLG